MNTRLGDIWGAVGVILPAGGKGLRIGGPEPKQFLPLRPGRSMLSYSVEAFSRLDCVASIALVLPRERMDAFAALAQAHPKVHLVEGGAERWESVRNGYLATDPRLPYVLVHDVARPFVSEAVIRRCLQSVTEEACAIAALPASDTVKQVSGDLVKQTLDRDHLILVQTPQAFPRAVLDAVYALAENGPSPSIGIPTDEAMMAERAGYAVRWVRGADALRKITGAADLAWAKWMAERLDSGETLADA